MLEAPDRPPSHYYRRALLWFALAILVLAGLIVLVVANWDVYRELFTGSTAGWVPLGAGALSAAFSWYVMSLFARRRRRRFQQSVPLLKLAGEIWGKQMVDREIEPSGEGSSRALRRNA